MSDTQPVSGPDFTAGVGLGDIPAEGTLAGRVGDDPVLLSRLGGELFAIGGACTHYGGHLGDGLIGETTVRCPLHHACFNLKTGTVLRAPALDPVDRWQVDVEGGRAFVRKKIEGASKVAPAPDANIGKIAIVGGGAAGLACALELRRLGYDGELTILSADKDPPYDRPNLSKDYLAGTAPEEWLPLRSGDWYSENRVDLKLSTAVAKVDSDRRVIHCIGGDYVAFDRLLIATGSEPNRLDSPGFDAANVFTLRTVEDARAIMAKADPGKRCVIVGASFIAMEAAGSLRQRGVEVDIAAPEQVPFERVFGTDLGKHLKQVHEKNGVRFHTGTVAAGFDGSCVSLANGQKLTADFVLLGIGVWPRVELAVSAGCVVDNGVLVDEHLESSVPGIYAAGDIASYPDPINGGRARIEHWVVAERQGETAAANMLGMKKRFDSAPFFWTDQVGTMIRYVGRGDGCGDVKIEGDLNDSFCIRYFSDGVHRATATVGRDRENLEDEVKLEARAHQKASA